MMILLHHRLRILITPLQETYSVSVETRLRKWHIPYDDVPLSLSQRPVPDDQHCPVLQPTRRVRINAQTAARGGFVI